MVDSPVEDPRKKRDNAQVHYDHEENKPTKAQKASKLNNEEATTAIVSRQQKINRDDDGDDRVADDDDDDDDSSAAILPSPPKRRATSDTRKAPPLSSAKSTTVAALKNPAGSSNQTNSATTKTSFPRIWDLESAMLQLVRLNNNPSYPIETAITNTNTNTNTTKSNPKNPPTPSQTLESSTTALRKDKRTSEREYITMERDAWITFRMAHSGDAATIASWYREAERKQLRQDNHGETDDDEEEKPEIDINPPPPLEQHDDDHIHHDDSPGAAVSHSSMLEHWLAEGLGDEVTCPSVYGLLCFVHSDGDDHNKQGKQETTIGFAATGTTESINRNRSSSPPRTKNTNMAAVVLLTLSWTSDERHLRVEWIGLNPTLSPDLAETVQQKVWLRITALSVMTGCPVIAVDKQQLLTKNVDAEATRASTEKDKASDKRQPRVVPSAE
ncbi:hypothetical protein IV203_038433 [Nitzschia inconspicua]|uniref:Uncharacterized protein n=1 Tax=Nitzschia inconspicua TaxID=303405 RepID=A0A9K3PZT9_9STRA|nr:hypothetical protein IV203_038433 [Nitzschia inconspicua]